MHHIPAGIYLLKVNKRNGRTRYEICSKLTIKTPEQQLKFEQVNASWDIASDLQLMLQAHLSKTITRASLVMR